MNNKYINIHNTLDKALGWGWLISVLLGIFFSFSVVNHFTVLWNLPNILVYFVDFIGIAPPMILYNFTVNRPIKEVIKWLDQKTQ